MLPGFLVEILIGLIIIALIYWVVTILPLPAPIKQVATVVIVVFAAIWLIYILAGFLPAGSLWRHS